MDIKRRLGQAYGVAGKDEAKEEQKPRAPVAARPQGRPIGPRGEQAPKKAERSREPDARAVAASESYIKTGLPGIEKAAKFLLLLGRDEAANVIRHLKPAEIENVSREIARIDRIDTAEANEILTEFGWLAKTQGASLEGGPEIAESMLAAAFGAERAREVFLKAVPESRKPFEFLNDFEARQLMVLFKDESPQMIAMILPHIGPKLASGVISELPPAVRADVIQRIARLDRSAPDVIDRVEAVLRDKAARIGRADSGERIDGAAVLAGILKHVDGGLEDDILSGIEEDNPVLSKDIRERLFTADDILRVADRDMQKGLRDLSERDIALVLKGKSQAFRDKVLSNVSQGKRTMVLEEYDIMGTVRRDDADKATKSFIDAYKRKWEAGDLILEGDDDLID
ncbi:MAG: flagellar motor switch protein FliG [Spirochaetes bacterium]|nr:flagellar motor switch protein FliG [Spirochaetota bacterium]MBU1081033.1 flagellar motor switch protein FliG [Spirochaetota bacterium]